MSDELTDSTRIPEGEIPFPYFSSEWISAYCAFKKEFNRPEREEYRRRRIFQKLPKTDKSNPGKSDELVKLLRAKKIIWHSINQTQKWLSAKMDSLDPKTVTDGDRAIVIETFKKIDRDKTHLDEFDREIGELISNLSVENPKKASEILSKSAEHVARPEVGSMADMLGTSPLATPDRPSLATDILQAFESLKKEWFPDGLHLIGMPLVTKAAIRDRVYGVRVLAPNEDRAFSEKISDLGLSKLPHRGG